MFLVLFEQNLEFHDWRLEDLFFYLSFDNVWKIRKKCKQETCFQFIRQLIKCETKISITMKSFNLLKWFRLFFSVSSVNIWLIVYQRNLETKNKKHSKKQMLPNCLFIIWCGTTQFKSRDHGLKCKENG